VKARASPKFGGKIVSFIAATHGIIDGRVDAIAITKHMSFHRLALEKIDGGGP
jgi:hypothetical protein